MSSRREVIKVLIGGGAALYLSPLSMGKNSSIAFAQTKTGGKQLLSKQRLAELSPINRSLGEIAPRIFFSDYPDHAHKVLWDKAGYIAGLGGKVPDPKERVPVVVIGGGISGLTAAYKLRQHKPIIIEQAPRFGGNAKGQSWRGIDYAIGAAYMCKPTEGNDVDVLFKELGLDKAMKEKAGEDPVAIGNKIFKEFWKGETVAGDAKAEAQFAKLAKYLQTVFAGEEISYPDIPVVDPEKQSYIDELDKVSFKSHLETIAEEPLHPHIETAIEHYCWSSFGSSSTEISAACGLNFYCAEFGELGVFPGGNAAIAERMLEVLGKDLPEENFRADSLVFNVKVIEDGVVVSYCTTGGEVKSIHAKTVVMACPKFVVGKILEDIELERLEAIKQLKFRSYLVANVMLKGGYEDPFYDLYLLGEGKLKHSEAPPASREQKVTDVILATWVKPNRANTVLTLYRGLPYDSARAELLAPDSYGRIRDEFEKQISGSILPLLKLKQDQVVDVRIARWGHPIPVAAVGQIANGLVGKLRAPFKDRVFFIEQDNWALPAFETCIAEASAWVPEIEKVLA